MLFLKMTDSKPQPLTEDQRTEVRSLLKQLSEASSARASKRGSTRPILKTTKKLKVIPNPFEGIDEGQTVQGRSEEHTSELQSPVPISYAVFCLKKKKNTYDK